MKGLILRTRAEWIEGAEKNTKYFASIERKKAEAKTIKQLRTDQGLIEKDSKKILAYTKDFFGKLYEKNDTLEQNDSLFTNGHRRLSEEKKLTTGGFITEYECEMSLKDMKNNKSPGSDGLSVEFYNMFWNDIKTYLVNSLNYSYDNGRLTELQTQSIITLIPKKNKDVQSINNWRPISLLNVDYKIAAKAVANRIKNVINDIVNNNQTGFRKIYR